MSAVDILTRQLDQVPDEAALLRIAWDALTLAADVADALAWQDGVHATAALAATNAAMAGRDLLPLPADSPRLPAADPAQLEDVALLLGRVRDRLDAAGRTDPDPDRVLRAHACADHAAEAAACLRNARS
jgi:hypothetical protein